MTKRIIRETVREFDTGGNLVRETVTETTEDDDSIYYPYCPIYPQPHCPNNTPEKMEFTYDTITTAHNTKQ